MWQIQYRKIGEQEWQNVAQRMMPLMETAADKVNALKLLRINDANINGGSHEFRAVKVQA